ncbi:MAG: uridine kinase [Pedosphaera sp.]|nr:uridine kinase [Pedosphaera sp.]
MKSKTAPLLVAITGGSGAGKSWLADQLQKKLGDKAVRISLDDFYRDRSHLSPASRARINFDHPRSIDWLSLERVLRDCLAWKTARIPQYDFATHARLPTTSALKPRPIILMEGLWLLRRPSLRQMFGVRIFIECPTKIRLNQRMARDLLSRGRNQLSIKHQFWKTVEPMNILYVVPQSKWAHIILKAPIRDSDVIHLAGQLMAQIKMISRPR